MKDYCIASGIPCEHCSLSNYGLDCQSMPMKSRVTEEQFRGFLTASKALDTQEYYRGYAYGLRRCFHGKQFGELYLLVKFDLDEGETGEGFRDGINGRLPRCLQINSIQKEVEHV